MPDRSDATDVAVRNYLTPVSLLYLLRDPKQVSAWENFVELYTPLLFAWSKKLGHQESDCADIVQDVFVILWRKLPDFEYDSNRSFHAWLKTIFLNRYRSEFRKHTLPAMNISTSDQTSDLEKIADDEEKNYLIRQAFRLIEQDYSELHQRVFRAYVMEDRRPEEVAVEFGIQVGTIYGIKSKILSHLRQKIERIFE